MKSFSLVLAALLGACRPAAAQADPPPLFVTGGFFAGIERLSNSRTVAPVPFSVNLSGTTTGGNIGVGTFLSPRWSVRVELVFPSKLETSFSPPTQPGIPLPPFTQQVHLDYRTRTGAVMLGYHKPLGDRVTVGYLGGIAFVQERQRTVTEITLRVPIIIFPPPARTESVFTTYRGAATAGMNVDLSITSHVAVVPQIRAYVFAGSLSIKPGVAARWSF